MKGQVTKIFIYSVCGQKTKVFTEHIPPTTDGLDALPHALLSDRSAKLSQMHAP